MSTTGDMIRRVSRALTGEMASAVAKLMSNMDLVYAASKIHVITHCDTTLGLPGTLSFRVQANHPADSIEGITASTLEGLSYTSGDACIGINPNDDSVENTIRIMNAIQEIKHRYGVPTQTVVLSHITTQMAAIEQGGVADMLFQSIAGTQKCNEEFGITAALLDEALDMIRKMGGAPGPNLMYFETGQGSEFTYGKHNGIDMTTTEALCYGLARRLRPVHGQQRHRLHRPRDAPGQLRDGPGQPAGPLHGQAARPADGHGAVLHAARQHHAREASRWRRSC